MQVQSPSASAKPLCTFKVTFGSVSNSDAVPSDRRSDSPAVRPADLPSEVCFFTVTTCEKALARRKIRAYFMSSWKCSIDAGPTMIKNKETISTKVERFEKFQSLGTTFERLLQRSCAQKRKSKAPVQVQSPITSPKPECKSKAPVQVQGPIWVCFNSEAVPSA